MKDAYITSSEITLRIPRVVPKNVINKITVVSAGGSAEINCALAISTLLVSGMSNEYAPARQKMAIVRQNFDFYVVTDEKGKIL